MKTIQLKKKILWFVASCCIFLILYIIYTYFYVEIQTDLSSLQSCKSNSIVKTAEQSVNSANISNVVITENVVEPNKFIRILRFFWKNLIQNGDKYPILQNKLDYRYYDIRDVNHLQSKLQLNRSYAFSVINTQNIKAMQSNKNIDMSVFLDIKKELWYGIIEKFPGWTEDKKIQLLYNYTCEANNQEKGLGCAKEFPTIKPYSLRNQVLQSKDPLRSKDI